MKGKYYSEGFIKGNELNLHYLDWGGTGEPLILIHGLGDTPYLFEDLAEALKGHLRVIAYSKRGHGKTFTNDTSYDNKALVSDIKLLLDSLRIQKANLLGWSMGGNEITEFAIQYPDRTNKLIYFEAGYDLSEEPFKQILQMVKQSAFAKGSDLESLNAYRNWYSNFWFPDVEWNSTLESNLNASVKMNPDGSVITIPNDNITRSILQSAMSYSRKYELINAPALVLFTNAFFKAAKSDTITAAFYDRMEEKIIEPWRRRSMERIRNELKNSTIKILPKGSHVSFMFLSKDEIVLALNKFLLK